MGEHHLIIRDEELLPSHGVRIPGAPDILNHCFKFRTNAVFLGPYSRYTGLDHVKYSFTLRLCAGNYDLLQTLNDKLAEMVKELRGYYDAEKFAYDYSDYEFTRMMAHDGCFILCYIKDVFPDSDNWIRSNSIVLRERNVRGDIFMIKNQIPYQVLIEVMKLVPDNMWDIKIKHFVDTNIWMTESCKRSVGSSDENDPIPATTTHLLELLQTRITKYKFWSIQVGDILASSLNATKLNEFKSTRFRPNTYGSLARVTFVKDQHFSYLELPPIFVDKCTVYMLLSLVGQEMSFGGAKWITMYLCLLHSLIINSSDVRLLQESGVLQNSLSNDEEVVFMFKYIREYLKPVAFDMEFVIGKNKDGMKVKTE